MKELDLQDLLADNNTKEPGYTKVRAVITPEGIEFVEQETNTAFLRAVKGKLPEYLERLESV